MREITRKVSSIWTRFRAEVIFIHVLTKLDFHYSRQIIHLWKECSSFEISFFSSLGRHKNEKKTPNKQTQSLSFFLSVWSQVTSSHDPVLDSIFSRREGREKAALLTKDNILNYWPLFAMLLFSFPIIKHQLSFNELF